MSCCGEPRTGRPFNACEEGPSDADLRRFGRDDITCPECGEEMFASATKCPSCGYLVDDGTGRTGLNKTWIAGVAILALVAFVFVFVM